MARDLINIKFKRVALVDKGANFDTESKDGAHIMLWKRHVEKDSHDMSQIHVDSMEWEKSDLTTETRNALPDSAFAAVYTDAQGKKQRKLPIHDAGHLAAARGRIDGADLPVDVKAAARRKIDAATKKESNVQKSIVEKILGLFSETDVTKRDAAAAEILKAAANSDDPMDDETDDVAKKTAADKLKEEMDQKAKSKDVAKKFEDIEKVNIDLAKKLTETTELLKAERDIRQKGEMTSVLKSFKVTPFNLDSADKANDIDKFLKMQAESPEGFARTMELFKAADAQLAESALFARQVGSSHAGAGSAEAQLMGKAEAIVQKSANKLSKEAAFEQASLENPKLVAQYRAEQQ